MSELKSAHLGTVDRFELPSMNSESASSVPAGRLLVIVAALGLAACVPDMRGEITTPQYLNPLEEIEQAPESSGGEDADTNVDAVETNPVHYIIAQAGDTARIIAERIGADSILVAELNGVFPDAPLAEGRLVQVPIDIEASSAQKITEIASSALKSAESENLRTDSEASPLSTRTAGAVETGEEVPPPPSSETTIVSVSSDISLPESPAFGNLQTDSSPQFLFPVSGEIIRDYSSGPNGNEGIDIAAREGTPVVAAGDGMVMLISRSTDKTAIVLLRHDGEIFTVYSYLTDIEVEKGQRVSRGQPLGKVAGGENEFLHFEVRIGTESTDPIPFLS
ncbi:MAG: M23 family metallopeptidase [Rhodobacteraceae bacterium]|nr:M23 family metallopeptidase [Paracoccaceae bacterium]